MEKLSKDQIAAAGLADWRSLAQGLHARFRIPDFTVGAQFVTAVAALAEERNHHPDLRMTYGVIDVRVVTHEAGQWVTDLDTELAARISETAAGLGLAADPAAVVQLELALDSADAAGLGPFWSALLTGAPDNTVFDSVFDPTGRVPAMWFQETDSTAPDRQRWHFDLWVAPEEADGRIAAALAVGGSVVDDSEAPSFTVLADSDGNRVCVCTSLDRD
ncbi:4a-hydroxytetrahydrobiopterin dehydratase [Nakamurella sp. YIM 132087]|uniref:Putative pterin-4-alpha-carbinolamine dehydratase n=1 Tax=Nakamurella alba TaxID=2665158 RepID=A0A7K1FIP2_9ACTN|nr:4a-hydroxytetrahydrobiopterin dehydratase [Nakamurella alba]MTD13995.1 4a-hydroxytetrahydrobiopterin dehydratase [Nakamurella alba]